MKGIGGISAQCLSSFHLWYIACVTKSLWAWYRAGVVLVSMCVHVHVADSVSSGERFEPDWRHATLDWTAAGFMYMVHDPMIHGHLQDLETVYTNAGNTHAVLFQGVSTWLEGTVYYMLLPATFALCNVFHVLFTLYEHTLQCKISRNYIRHGSKWLWCQLCTCRPAIVVTLDCFLFCVNKHTYSDIFCEAWHHIVCQCDSICLSMWQYVGQYDSMDAWSQNPIACQQQVAITQFARQACSGQAFIKDPTFVTQLQHVRHCPSPRSLPVFNAHGVLKSPAGSWTWL